MGRNLPYNRTDALEWTLSHLGRWEAVAGEIGLDELRVLSMMDAAQAAREALIEAEIARARARAATATWHRLADAMKAEVSASVSLIKTTAALEARVPGGGGESAERAIYTKAWLSFPGTPSRAPAPRAPGLPLAHMDGSGGVVLAWTGKGPSGTRYTVMRDLGSANAWTILGDTHDKTITDRTVPIGTPSVAYRVVAKYGPHAVEGPATLIRFGSIPGQTDGQREAPGPVRGPVPGRIAG